MLNNLTKVEKVVIIVTVIAITLIFGGIGYAFFTMNDNTGSTAEVTNTSGKMTITYADGGSNLLVSSNISPSNTIIANKTFTLTGLNTTTAGDGLAMEYKVVLKYTSTFSAGQIHYYIKKISTTNEDITTTFTGEVNQTVPGNDTYTGYSHGTLNKGNNKYTEMVTGEFPASKDSQTITFNLVMQFPDTGENQDTEKGKSINAEVVVNYEPEVEYIATTIINLYDTSEKDENGITLDGLQKDGTGDFNVTLVNNSYNKSYNVSLLNNMDNIIADTEYDEYDNLRYVGANPNNYISFNNEVWRIIGIFNVYNNDTQKTEKLIKIIRNDSLGNYSWDSSAFINNDGFIINGDGINEWSQAKLMYELNCDGKLDSKYCNSDIEITEGYLSSNTSGTTTWYNGRDNKKSGSYDYSKNIKSDYINKIANVRWNLGGFNYSTELAKSFYTSERGTTHIVDPTDGVTRTNTWDGKVGLMYPSDYGYASTDADCRNNLSSFDCSKNFCVAYCKNNNWLSKDSSLWTLSPFSDSANKVSFVFFKGNVDFYSDYDTYGVRPALFLKSETQIAGGTGTSSDPYTLK